MTEDDRVLPYTTRFSIGLITPSSDGGAKLRRWATESAVHQTKDKLFTN